MRIGQKSRVSSRNRNRKIWGGIIAIFLYSNVAYREAREECSNKRFGFKLEEGRFTLHMRKEVVSHY